VPAIGRLGFSPVIRGDPHQRNPATLARCAKLFAIVLHAVFVSTMAQQAAEQRHAGNLSERACNGNTMGNGAEGWSAFEPLPGSNLRRQGTSA